MRERNDLPSETCRRIIRRKAERVSEDAGDELSEILEETAKRIGKEALSVMNETGTKTLKREHVIEARKRYFNEN